MRAKSGLPPYDAGIFFILNIRNGKLWPPRRVGTVSAWKTTQMLAHMYGKRVTDVARDIIERAELLEEGDPDGYQRQQRKRETAA
jgi:hypothetical protein